MIIAVILFSTVIIMLIVSRKVRSDKQMMLFMMCAFIVTISTIFGFIIVVTDVIIKDDMGRKDIVTEEVKKEFETTDVNILKRIESSKDYEKYEVVVEGELIKIIFIDDGESEKRIVVD